MRIFISGHRDGEEAQLAARLHRALWTLGYAVVMDFDLDLKIEEASQVQRSITESDIFILLVSGNSIAQEAVQAEVRVAHLAHRKLGRPRILPVRVGYDGPLDYEIEFYIGRLPYIRWTDRDDDNRVISYIANTMTGTLVNDEPPIPVREAIVIQPPGGRPNPAMDLRALTCPGGTMALQDPLYIRRHCDSDIDSLARSQDGQTLVIRGPRQRGKSSLLVRFLAARRDCNRKIALIDFQTFGGIELESYPEFLTSLALALVDILEIQGPEPMIRRQGDMNRFLQRTVLETTGPLALAFDEVDRAANRGYKTDFFGMLRGWHNSRATLSATGWPTLDLALALSTEPELLIEDAYQSPFNVGQVIELDSFTKEQCYELNDRYTPGQLRRDQVDEIYDLVNGHPYLTRLAYHRVLTGSLALPIDNRTAIDLYGPFGDHLRALLNKLSRQPALLKAMQRIIRDRSAEPAMIHRLRSAGLVRTVEGVAVPSNILYTTFFRSIK